MANPTDQQSANDTEQVSAKLPAEVNSEITDSVEQANAQALQSMQIIAMGNLYQATAQALANAAHNATNQQQQAYVTAQAATTMGVATMLSLDTASTGVATQQIFGAAKVATPEATRAQIDEAMAALKAPTPKLTTLAAKPADGGAHTSEDFAQATHAVMAAFASSLDHLNDTAYRQLLQIIKLAANAACLAAMIRSPEQAKGYEHVLKLIERLE